jgi:hypothetical protein
MGAPEIYLVNQRGEAVPIVRAVTAYVGRRPRFTRYTVLDAATWDRQLGPDSALFGGTAAIFTSEGEIVVRAGYESDVIHELVHAAGVHERSGQTSFVSEGLTQAAAADLAAQHGLTVRSTYREETHFVWRYLVPLTGGSLRTLVRGYVRAGIDWIVARILRSYGTRFAAAEWGPPAHVRAELFDALARAIGGGELHLRYLVDELHVV